MTLDLSGKTILLADDEMFSRTTVTRLLDDMGKPNVIQAVDGQEALEALSSGRYRIDLIISDFNMPRKHGLDFLRSVRMGGDNFSRNIPFALLTGYGDKHLVDLALALDVSAFLVKPASKNALESRLTKMLQQLPEDRSIKPQHEYQEIEVAEALEEIMGFRRTKKPPQKARGVAVMKKGKPLVSPPTDSDVAETAVQEAPPAPETPSALEDSSTDAAPPEEAVEATKPPEKADAPTPQTGGFECPLEDVPVGAVLARDVYTADGRLFMSAGYAVSGRVISILIDLQDLGHPVKSIWIER